MNANAKKWVAALRSGKYKQAEGALNVNGSFCCLGVACELAMEDLGLIKRQRTPDLASNGSYNYGSVGDYALSFGTLPHAVVDWLGLRTESGAWLEDIGPSCGSLVAANDQLHLNFEQIANIIESEPKGLFRENS